jgi:hypothetical protein
MFWKMDMFSFSGEVKETPTLLGPLERPNFKHWTMGKLQKLSDTESHTPLSESFRLYMLVNILKTTHGKSGGGGTISLWANRGSRLGHVCNNSTSPCTGRHKTTCDWYSQAATHTAAL